MKTVLITKPGHSGGVEKGSLSKYDTLEGKDKVVPVLN
jgi:hypothetical protein